MILRTRVLSIALLSSAVLGGECISAFGQDSGYTLKVNVRDPEHILSNIERWNSLLRGETGGALSVEPSQASLNDEQRLAGVLSGKLGIAQVFFTMVDERAPSLQAFGAPFLFEDEDHVSRIVENADVMQLPSRELAARGLRLLGVGYNGGFLYILSAGKELRRLEDFSALRIGDELAPPSSNRAALPVTAKLFGHLGARIVRCPSIEAADSLSWRRYFTGKEAAVQGRPTLLREAVAFALDKDSWELPLDRPARGPLAKLTLNETRHAVFLSAFVTSERLFQSLPVAHQAALVKTAMHFAREERAQLSDRDARALRLFRKEGWRIVALPVRERERLAQASRALDGQLPASARATLERILAVPSQIRYGNSPATSSR